MYRVYIRKTNKYKNEKEITIQIFNTKRAADAYLKALKKRDIKFMLDTLNYKVDEISKDEYEKISKSERMILDVLRGYELRI